MRFEFDALGQWTTPAAFEVVAEHIKAYAAAINDTDSKHLQGFIAPPMFAVVPAMRSGATRTVDRVVISEVSGYDLRKVHGEQDIFFCKPILPGMVLYSRAAPIGVHVKSSGTIVTVKSETRDGRDEMINYQYWTVFFRGVFAPGSAGAPAPRHLSVLSDGGVDPVAVRTYRVDHDQPRRYAEASGDRGPYHLDEASARAAGFPGVILHGLCTMAFASRAVIEAVCLEDASRLRRFAVRFTRPAYPGQDLTTSIWAVQQRDDVALYGVEVSQPAGTAVIKPSVAEVRR